MVNLAFLNKIVWNKQTVALVVIISLALVYVDVGFLMKLQMQVLSQVGPKTRKLKKNIASLNKDLAEMRLAQQEAERLKNEPVKVKKLMNAEEFPVFLEKLSALANIYGVKIMQLNTVKQEAPAPPKQKKSKAAQESAPVAAAKANFSVFILTMDFSCDYHKLGIFLNQVDDLPAIVYVQSLSIVPGDGLRQSANTVLKVYVN